MGVGGSVKDSFFSVLNSVYLMSGQLKIMTKLKSLIYQEILGLEYQAYYTCGRGIKCRTIHL